MGALSIIILATWVGRGVILSGYPFFPSSVVAMPVTWRTPATRVDGFRTLIRGWARDRENVERSLRGWQWISNWYQRVAPELTNRFIWPAQSGFAGLVVLAGFATFASRYDKIYEIFSSWLLHSLSTRFSGS